MHLPFQPPKDKYSNSNKSVPLTRKRIEKNTYHGSFVERLW